MQILIASKNKNKIDEIKNILPNFNLISLLDLNDNYEVIEDGNTFYDNALLKASYYHKKYKLPVIADDSGLLIDSLNGKPGVHSKRFSGGDDNENNKLVLNLLKGVKNRKASFKTVIIYIDKEGKINKFEGIWKGVISNKIEGKEGFGYDPIFIPEGKKIAVSKLGNLYKNKNSHRSKAILLLKNYLNENINN